MQPKIKEMRIANVTGIPDPNRPAVSALDKAQIDPTDKSIPPVRITKVIPKAISAFDVTCNSKFNRLFAVKKFELIIVMTAIKIINAITVVNSDMYFIVFFTLLSSCS